MPVNMAILKLERIETRDCKLKCWQKYLLEGTKLSNI